MLKSLSAPNAHTGADSYVEEAQLFMTDIFDLGHDKASAEELCRQDLVLCAGTDSDIFFLEKGGSMAPVTSVYTSCPVQAERLEHVIPNDTRHGIQGGMSDNDRRRIPRERHRAHGA